MSTPVQFFAHGTYFVISGVSMVSTILHNSIGARTGQATYPLVGYTTAQKSHNYSHFSVQQTETEFIFQTAFVYSGQIF